MEQGDSLDPAVMEKYGAYGSKASRFAGTIYEVTMIATAVSGISGYAQAQMPFTDPIIAIGATALNTQTPFQFTFNYPSNNFSLSEAHLIIDTQKDSSDTEGIFYEGVTSGKPPGAAVNTSSPLITSRQDYWSSATTKNLLYLDWGLTHYEINNKNTFDLNVKDLLSGTSITPYDTVKDGIVNVVTTDDSPIFQGHLLMNGVTISKSPLTCTNSSTKTFENLLLSNDGNSTGSATFSGAGAPYQTWPTAGSTYSASEFYYDQKLPGVPIANISITNALIRMNIKRNASGKAAIVVSGVGVAETGFDKSTATSAVESWYDAGTSAFETYLSAIPTTGAATTANLNLLTIFGEAKLKTMLAQGKLNIALAGSINRVGPPTTLPNGTTTGAIGATSGRTYGTQVYGPNLDIDGTWYVSVCEVPDNANSPLSQGAVPEVTQDDGASPTIDSISVTDITSTSAKIVWLTDKYSTSQVGYGITGITNYSSETGPDYIFHSVTLTGLSPYKYYKYQIISKDKFGNTGKSSIAQFVTLR
jgi:hypothetical protein